MKTFEVVQTTDSSARKLCGTRSMRNNNQVLIGLYTNLRIRLKIRCRI